MENYTKNNTRKAWNKKQVTCHLGLNRRTPKRGRGGIVHPKGAGQRFFLFTEIPTVHRLDPANELILLEGSRSSLHGLLLV